METRRILRRTPVQRRIKPPNGVAGPLVLKCLGPRASAHSAKSAVTVN